MTESFDVTVVEDAVSDSEVELGRLGALSADLTSYAESLESIGTINLSLAASIEAICPGTIDPLKFPLSSYTETNTLTNYSVTLEAIGEQLLDIGKKIIAAIVKILKKIGKFFMDLWEHIWRRDKRREAVEEEIIEVQKATLYLTRNVPSDLKEEVDEALAYAHRYLENDMIANVVDINRNLLHSIIKYDHEHKAVVAMGRTFIDYLNNVNDRIIYLDAELRVLSQHPDMEREGIIALEREQIIIRYVNPTFYNELTILHLLPHDGYNPKAIAKAIGGLKDRISYAFESDSLPPPTFSEVMNSDARKSFIRQAEALPRYYKRLTEEISRLDHLEGKAANIKIFKHINNLGDLIRSEFHAAANFLAIANHYSTVALEVTRLDLKAKEYIKNAVVRSRRRQARGK